MYVYMYVWMDGRMAGWLDALSEFQLRRAGDMRITVTK